MEQPTYLDSVTLKTKIEAMEARLLAQSRNRRRKKPNFTPSNAVEIAHEDGSRLIFQSAFVIHEDHYYFVFTEHHGSHYYHETEAHIFTYERYPLNCGAEVSEHW